MLPRLAITVAGLQHQCKQCAALGKESEQQVTACEEHKLEQAYHNGHGQAESQIQALGHATHVEVKLQAADTA